MNPKTNICPLSIRLIGLHDFMFWNTHESLGPAWTKKIDERHISWKQEEIGRKLVKPVLEAEPLVKW
jgi:hypothetical protein